MVVAILFVTCLIVANIISVKLINIGGIILPAGIIIFPFNYIFGDILTEVYGYRQARRVIWLGFVCNFIAVMAFWVVGLLPGASDWDGQAAYQRILGFVPRLLLGSFVAYVIAEFANSFILAKMKIWTGGRFLWMRTIGSTVVGQGLDTVVFLAIAFGGVIPPNVLGVIILNHWLAKSAYEALATPLTYGIVNFLKKKEGIDTFDHRTKFNPFLFND